MRVRQSAPRHLPRHAAALPLHLRRQHLQLQAQQLLRRAGIRRAGERHHGCQR
jgi:hypothetical protein